MRLSWLFILFWKWTICNGMLFITGTWEFQCCHLKPDCLCKRNNEWWTSNMSLEITISIVSM
jgi:hypothetical protein